MTSQSDNGLSTGRPSIFGPIAHLSRPTATVAPPTSTPIQPTAGNAIAYFAWPTPVKVYKLAHIMYDIPYEKCTCNRELLEGPTVTVFVGEDNVVAFVLPKALLVKNSKIFDRAFNGPYREGTDQKMHLVETTFSAFCAVVRFLYGGHEFIGGPETSIDKWRHAMMDFFLTANMIDLRADLADAFKRTGEALALGPLPSRELLEKALDLPYHHRGRRIFIGACVTPFTRHASLACQGLPSSEYWPKDLDEFFKSEDDFAFELLMEYTKATAPYLRNNMIIDPLLGKEMRLWQE